MKLVRKKTISMDDIIISEKIMAIRFPKDYISFLLNNNGAKVYDGLFEDLNGNIRVLNSFFSILKTDELNIYKFNIKRDGTYVQKRVFWFAIDDSGNKIGMTKRLHRIIYEDHENNHTSVIFKNFKAFLNAIFSESSILSECKY